jgi:hypothetical protein
MMGRDDTRERGAEARSRQGIRGVKFALEAQPRRTPGEKQNGPADGRTVFSAVEAGGLEPPTSTVRL